MTSMAAPRFTRPSSKAKRPIEPGVPESFNVLIRELQSLCLDVELIKTNERNKLLVAPEAPVAAD